MATFAHEMRLVLLAIQYFTRLPVPSWGGYSDEEMNAALRYFPLAGIVVGGFIAIVYLAALQLFPHALAVLLAMLAGALMTGGFHEDALADACDGFGGGCDKAQILAIMKDPRIGSYGVLAMIFAFALKFAALYALPVSRFAAIVVSAHAFSRLMAVTVVFTQRYMRVDESARARPAAQSISRAALACAALFACAPLAWLGAAAIAAVPAAVVLRIILTRYFYSRIGGYTGDCLGAIQQVTEIGFYLAVIAWSSI